MSRCDGARHVLVLFMPMRRSCRPVAPRAACVVCPALDLLSRATGSLQEGRAGSPLAPVTNQSNARHRRRQASDCPRPDPAGDPWHRVRGDFYCRRSVNTGRRRENHGGIRRRPCRSKYERSRGVVRRPTKTKASVHRCGGGGGVSKIHLQSTGRATQR